MAPKLSMTVTSRGLDLDELLKLPDLNEFMKADDAAAQTPQRATPSKTAKTTAKSGKTGSTTVAAKGSKGKQRGLIRKGSGETGPDMDKLLNPIRESEFLAKSAAKIDISIKSLKVYDITISDINSRLTLRNLVAAVKSFELAVFDGKFSTSARVNMKPARPKYKFQAKLVGLDLEKAVKSSLELFKNTAYGKLNFTAKGSGQSMNPELAKKNLDASGNFRIDRAIFTSIDVGKMVNEAISKGINGVASKYPALKGKKIRVPNIKTKFEFVRSDFSLKNAIFNAPNFMAKAVKNKGLDITGRTRVNIISQDINAKWWISDTYNISKARDLGVKIAGIQIKSLLADGKTVRFPVSVGCKLMAPCYKYTEVPGHFMKVALKNAGGAAKKKITNKAKKALKKKAKSFLRKLF